MRILHINTTDVTGGAGIAAYRLHKALRKHGIESFMLVQSKKSNDEYVIKKSKIPYINKIREELDKLPAKFALKNKNELFSTAILPENIISEINKINPDIIHLHWINGGFVKIETLSELNKPVVWSLHDMWSFTGACHYDAGCSGYINTCTNCPFLKNKSKLAHKTFMRKLNAYKQIDNLNINGLSKWIAEEAKKSPLFIKRHVFNLPNCIDTKDFFPLEKKQAKKTLNLPENKKVILFGAVAATTDNRKGFDLLQAALNKSDKKSDKITVVFGNENKKNEKNNGLECRYTGKISGIERLRTVYSAADVVVVPSRQENLSNVVLEAMACGTPVVAFNTGGMPDMIKHLQTGYLAECFSPEDLKYGINRILYHDNYDKISQNAVKTIKSEFDCSVVTPRYIELYISVMQ